MALSLTAAKLFSTVLKWCTKTLRTPRSRCEVYANVKIRYWVNGVVFESDVIMLFRIWTAVRTVFSCSIMLASPHTTLTTSCPCTSSPRTTCLVWHFYPASNAQPLSLTFWTSWRQQMNHSTACKGNRSTVSAAFQLLLLSGTASGCNRWCQSWFSCCCWASWCRVCFDVLFVSVIFAEGLRNGKTTMHTMMKWKR